ncbi:DNA methylase N-4/N-6 domain protein [Sulfobacillus thermosulfidooxidans DSM 9293]|uniref:DNA methylase N-4/N-6 domain protein n=1 Tax=Sulfobacillus thermosulfidooxidans (strain DSM 9293 / VKM B-1269 / AT-1) TaxID=929705 RepID=A0A1W1WKN2_SULTA|nr:hypothetical protein [Sulfobacillus thermosulfidooxidans]SMC06871.1 DNA methylase N-4/N-6 domain protein [Sulfobacillus thermosulfidooxidans DSM 9293]
MPEKPFLTTRHGVLYQDDAIDVMSAIQSNVIDTIFADPPFNLGKDYKNGFNDNLEEQWT